jgi:hypothetical protein
LGLVVKKRFWEDSFTWGEHGNVHGLRNWILGETCDGGFYSVQIRRRQRFTPRSAPPLEVKTYSCLSNLD